VTEVRQQLIVPKITHHTGNIICVVTSSIAARRVAWNQNRGKGRAGNGSAAMVKLLQCHLEQARRRKLMRARAARSCMDMSNVDIDSCGQLP
jgi:hypothetical protein